MSSPTAHYVGLAMAKLRKLVAEDPEAAAAIILAIKAELLAIGRAMSLTEQVESDA